MSPTSRRIAILTLLLVGVACVRLGLWQLDRLSQRRAANAAALGARARPPIDLTGGRAGGPQELDNRWVEGTGVYDRAHEVVIRGEAFQGVPGVHLVTPLRLRGSDTAVLVLRGFVPAPDAVRAEVTGLEEPGTVSVRGLASAIPSGSGVPLEHAGRTSWARLDLAALRQRTPYPLLPVVIRQVPDPALPRSPRRLPPSELTDGPHLNYAIQWFLFAGMAVTFAIVVVGRTRAR
jgi:surfeit locus 1 family protein